MWGHEPRAGLHPSQVGPHPLAPPPNGLGTLLGHKTFSTAHVGQARQSWDLSGPQRFRHQTRKETSNTQREVDGWNLAHSPTASGPPPSTCRLTWG